MMKDGKILFFNENDGKGIIITSEKEKIDFYINDWADFDVMPCLGLEVFFDFKDEKALNITSKTKNRPEYKELRQDKKEKLPEELGSLDPQEISKKEIVPAETLYELSIDIAHNQKETQKAEKKSGHENNKKKDIYSFKLPEVRPDSITISTSISNTISNYFSTIKSNINTREAYKKISGSLDYITIKRFLFTTYNNLSDIDLTIITPKIKLLYTDLKNLSTIYDNFLEKVKYPNLAYQEVFLSFQTNYVRVKDDAKSTIEKLSLLKTDEERLAGLIKIKKDELVQKANTLDFASLQFELKSLNGVYVDTVHLMAELDEHYKYNMQLLHKFEKEYKADFAESFTTESLFYKKHLLKILNAQAYLLDMLLWQEAKKSETIKEYFKKLSIGKELNTKTYLKYYLDSLDSSKATDEMKKLFSLYEYLVSIQKEYIVIVVNSTQDAMDYESCIKKLNSSYNVKAFIDEKSAIQWAVKNSVKILIIEDCLQNMSVEKFLSAYKKYVTITPKIILLGEKPRVNLYPITSLLPKNCSSKIIAENIKSLLNNK